MAQPGKQALADTFRLRNIDKNIGIRNRPVNKTLSAALADVDKVVAAYSNMENIQATWNLLKADAEKVLLKYFNDGRLAGTKPEQAFLVQVGRETMSAADIAAKKLVVFVGVATIKPAEFEMGRIEKTCGRWLCNEADSLIQIVLANNCSKPFTPQTFARIKLEAEGQLFIMYREGKLKGTNINQAFFVKIGPETMTTADIAAHKLVLEYGIAMIRPAEFESSRLEKICK